VLPGVAVGNGHGQSDGSIWSQCPVSRYGRSVRPIGRPESVDRIGLTTATPWGL
jgi:hypothetical protein